MFCDPQHCPPPVGLGGEEDFVLASYGPPRIQIAQQSALIHTSYVYRGGYIPSYGNFVSHNAEMLIYGGRKEG